MDRKGLFSQRLYELPAERLPLIHHVDKTQEEVEQFAATAPSNKQVLEACRGAYHTHVHAVDGTTKGTRNASQDGGLSGQIKALHAHDWKSGAKANLVTPVYQSAAWSPTLNGLDRDSSFITVCLGIQVQADFIIGGEGGVGVGFPFSLGPEENPFVLAWGGYRLGFAIDIGINLNTAIYIEPASKLAGDYLGLEISVDIDGVDMGLGIYMTPDLGHITGFALAAGVSLGLPENASIVSGKTVTTF